MPKINLKKTIQTVEGQLLTINEVCIEGQGKTIELTDLAMKKLKEMEK